MSRMPADRAQAALLRALRLRAGPFTVVAASSRTWASATFEGSQHDLRLALDGTDADGRAERLAATLGDTDLPLAGAFVADLTTDREAGATLSISALVIEDA